jgi:predicted acyltransferase
MTAENAVAPTAVAEPSTKPGRLVSLDAYRGLIMLFMASGGFGLHQVAELEQFKDAALWKFLAFHTEHTAWVGGGAWDMIQPAFMFMVGVAMPFSLARRGTEGQAFGRLLLHAIWRSFMLVALAVFLSTKSGAKQPNFVFTNVLAQIGLGYTFLFLLARRGWKTQLGALLAIAIGYWAFFALHPLPPPDMGEKELKAIGIKVAEVKEVVLTGFAAHWSKNFNAATAFDQWFLNLFPTQDKFVFNAGGYQTLNFVPSLITMILGLMAGSVLRGPHGDTEKLKRLGLVGAVCLALGLVAGATVCPIIKRIWTPSWALFSGGIVMWVLAVFYWIVDVRGWRAWAMPLVIVGMNSIAMYLMYQLLSGWIAGQLQTYLGQNIYSGDFGIVWRRSLALLSLWCVCWWMYRRKIFLRI